MTSVLLDFGVASHFFPIAGITTVGILVCTATVIGGQFCRSCAHDENCWLRVCVFSTCEVYQTVS